MKIFLTRLDSGQKAVVTVGLTQRDVVKHELVQRIIIAYEKYDKMEEYKKEKKKKRKK